jgi:hypothetical protein
MFCIYQEVLLPSQNLCLTSFLLSVDSSITVGGVVVNVRLQVGLIIQVRDTPFTGSVSHLIHPFLLSWLASEQVLPPQTRVGPPRRTSAEGRHRP